LTPKEHELLTTLLERIKTSFNTNLIPEDSTLDD